MRVWDYEYKFVDTDTIDYRLSNELEKLRNEGYVIETSYLQGEKSRIVLCQRRLNSMFVAFVVLLFTILSVIAAATGIYQSVTL